MPLTFRRYPDGGFKVTVSGLTPGTPPDYSLRARDTDECVAALTHYYSGYDESHHHAGRTVNCPFCRAMKKDPGMVNRVRTRE